MEYTGAKYISHLEWQLADENELENVFILDNSNWN